MRLMEKASVHDPINLFRWAIQRGYVTVEKPPAAPKNTEPQPVVPNWSVTVGDRTAVGRLRFALDRARERFLLASRDFSECAGDGAIAVGGPDRILRLELPDHRRQTAFEEYQQARRDLKEFLMKDAEGIASEEEL
jgi:hypothetical protein